MVGGGDILPIDTQSTENSCMVILLQAGVKSKIDLITEVASYLKSSTNIETMENIRRVTSIYEDLELFMLPLIEKHGESFSSPDFMEQLGKHPELAKKLNSLDRDSIIPGLFAKRKSSCILK